MADAARVDSIDAIRAFRTALWKFQETANVAMGDAESEVGRTLTWLESEQQSFWTGQIRKRSEMVSRCKEAVRMKKLFKDSTGRAQSAVDEEKALAKAIKRLEEAEQKLIATKQHSRRLVKEYQNYKGSVQRFATAVQSDIPVAAAVLDTITGLLDQYVSLGTAPEGSEASAAGQGFGAMARPAGDGIQPAAVDESEVYVTDLSNFPSISDPQVALVHAESETALVTLEDGSRYKGVGERYKIFDSADEAMAYARAKITTHPALECAIFGYSTNLVTVIRGAQAATETEPG